MPRSRIYLLNEKTKHMHALEEHGYIAEIDLQDFLSQHPDLLPGDQINPDDPRRWLLVSREMSVPGDEIQVGRWSLDHLFIDQDGIPTFVECKRSVDTRIRREVIAQMLDYAANGVEYWGIETIKQAAAATAEKDAESINDRIDQFIQSEGADDREQFWKSVEENLREHRVRLIFVSDHTPRELRRLVEFLNEEMLNTQVLAVDVKQYRSQERPYEIALVPRVIGLTESALATKSGSVAGRGRTTRGSFLNNCTPEARDFFDELLDRSIAHDFTIYWGEKGFSVRAPLADDGKLASFLYGYPPDKFQFYFAGSSKLTREKDNPIRKTLLDFGVFTESGEYTLTSLIRPENVSQYRNVVDFIISTITELTSSPNSTGKE